ncbi:MAG: sugar ABC transporter ATP-binding protein [Lachnospiraceae bacterium]
MEKKDILFQTEKITKTFGATKALSEVTVEIGRGEIRGLIGENGSGKSTFSTICAGIQNPSDGKMLLNGEKYHPSGTLEAMDAGISMIVQEQGTIAKISVAANIFFGKETLFSKAGFVSIAKMNSEAKKALNAIGVTDIKPEVMIDTLTFEERKLVEIARAYYSNPTILIVDETTTALTLSGRDVLYRVMDLVKERGGSVLFISHDLEEIMDKCDWLTVLRDGVVTASVEKRDFDEDAIKQLMIGRDISGNYYRNKDTSSVQGESVLEMKAVQSEGISDISLALHKGEILGIGGLSDCGMHELGKVLFGLVKPEKGEVLLKNHGRVKDAAWSVNHGIAYVSKNRDKESMMTICSIKDNICLPSLKALSRWGLITKKREKSLSEKWYDVLKVKANSVNQYCNTLSGGNKQKVVLAKWLAKGSDIMILDCPTRGIDIGTKASIYKIIEQLKDEGKAILLISEELAELIGMSDRVLVLKDGRISGEFFREEQLTETKLLGKMI